MLSWVAQIIITAAHDQTTCGQKSAEAVFLPQNVGWW